MKINRQEIENNLKQNPFYRPSNKQLIKEVQITAHLKSETPYIQIDGLSVTIDIESNKSK